MSTVEEFSSIFSLVSYVRGCLACICVGEPCVCVVSFVVCSFLFLSVKERKRRRRRRGEGHGVGRVTKWEGTGGGEIKIRICCMEKIFFQLKKRIGGK